MKILLAILLLFALSSGSVAYSQVKPKEYDAVVLTSNSQRFKGFLENASEDGITIDHLGQHKFIKADSIRQIRIKRSRALRKHALIASVGGMAAGYAIYDPLHDSGKLSILALPVYVIGGAIAGGTFGAFVNSFTSVQNYKPQGSVNNYKSIQPQLVKYSGSYLNKASK